MAAGYDENSKIVWLLGGGGSVAKKQLIAYNVTGSYYTDYGINALSHGVVGDGDYYTQISNELWMIDDSGETFNVFNVENGTIYT